MTYLIIPVVIIIIGSILYVKINKAIKDTSKAEQKLNEVYEKLNEVTKVIEKL